MHPCGRPCGVLRFRFRYTIFNVQAELGPERLLVKTGIKMVSVPVGRLTHLYVHDRPGHEHLELLLGYTKKAGGRIHRARVFADREEPGFAGLLAALLERRPEIDIRRLHRSEAFRQMGAVEAEWVVVPGAMAVGTLIVGVLLWPLLAHGLDTAAPAETTVAALHAGVRPATRNVLLTGVVVDGVTPVARKDGRPRWLAPLTPRVVLRLDAPTQEAAERALAREVIPGLLRDVWWEGVTKVERDAIGGAYRDALVVEVDGDRRADLMIVLLLLGSMGLATLLTLAYLRRTRAPTPR